MKIFAGGLTLEAGFSHFTARSGAMGSIVKKAFSQAVENVLA